jgi:hypothetical protein
MPAGLDPLAFLSVGFEAYGHRQPGVNANAD